jgi:hypothetical protein
MGKLIVTISGLNYCYTLAGKSQFLSALLATVLVYNNPTGLLDVDI